MKQSVIVSNKFGIYQLPPEMPNDSRLRKYQETLKALYKYSLVPSQVVLVPSLSPKMKILSILGKNSSKIEIELFP